MSKLKDRKHCKYLITFYPPGGNTFPIKFYADNYEWRDHSVLKFVNQENGKLTRIRGSLSIEEQ